MLEIIFKQAKPLLLKAMKEGGIKSYVLTLSETDEFKAEGKPYNVETKMKELFTAYNALLVENLELKKYIGQHGK